MKRSSEAVKCVANCTCNDCTQRRTNNKASAKKLYDKIMHTSSHLIELQQAMAGLTIKSHMTLTALKNVTAHVDNSLYTFATTQPSNFGALYPQLSKCMNGTSHLDTQMVDHFKATLATLTASTPDSTHSRSNVHHLPSLLAAISPLHVPAEQIRTRLGLSTSQRINASRKLNVREPGTQSYSFI